MPFVHTGFAALMVSTGLLAVGWVLVGRAGDRLMPLFTFSGYLDEGERFLFSIAVGTVLLAYGVWVLGLLAQLTPFHCMVLLGLFFVVPFFFPSTTRFFKAPFSFHRARVWFAFGLAAVFLSWIRCQLPPIGNDGLAYHLSHARDFLLQGRVGYLPGNRESLWPYQTEMLFILGLMFEGTTLTQLIHWSFYPLTAGLVYSFCRRFAPQTAAIAAVTFLFTPVAFLQSSHAYVDLSFAFYVFLSFYVWALTEPKNERGAAVLGGFFLGAALSTKYLALGLLPILTVLWFLRLRLKRRVLWVLVTAGLVGGGWYLRSWTVLGNPVYPFFAERFGGNGYRSDVAEGGMGGGLLLFLKWGWNLTLHPEEFGGEAVGPLFLIFLPFLLVRKKRPTTTAFLLAISVAAYSGFIFWQSQMARFFLSLIPLLSVGVGAAFFVIKERSKPVRWAAFGILGLTLAVHLGIFLYHAKSAWAVLSYRQTAAQFLETHERSYPGFVYLQNNAKTGEKILEEGEGRYFYNLSPVLTHHNVPWSEILKRQHVTLTQYLDNESYTYIWIRHDAEQEVWDYIRSRDFRLAHEYTAHEGGAEFKYSIYKKPS